MSKQQNQIGLILIVTTILTIIIGLFVLINNIPNSEIKTWNLSTYEEVINSNAKNLLPKNTPKTAENFHIKFDPDTNALWVTYNANEQEIKDITENLGLKEVYSNDQTQIPFADENWWPEKISNGNYWDEEENFITYLDDTNSVFIINLEEGNVYYWSSEG